MKRREALRNLSLGIGYVVSAPVALEILNSCSKSQQDWKAVFFDEKLKPLVNPLVDIILPGSDIPGGLELNLPQFTDKMCADILSPEDQEWVIKGGALFAEQVAQQDGGSAAEADREVVLEVFKTYFDLSSEEKKTVLDVQKKSPDEISEDEQDEYAVYKFLLGVREFTLLGYFTSERIGKDFLVFDPIPGGYNPCMPLSEVGNAWTIG